MFYCPCNHVWEPALPPALLRKIDWDWLLWAPQTFALVCRRWALLQTEGCVSSLVPILACVSMVLQTLPSPVQFHPELLAKLTSSGPHCSLTKGSPPPRSQSISLSACERISTGGCISQPLSWISISRPFQAPGSLAGLFGSSLSLLQIPEAHSLHKAN